MPEAKHPQLNRAIHGGPDGSGFDGLDFSVNANPHGPNPVLLEAARNADHTNYPDPGHAGLRASLAAFHGLEPQNIVPAVGASELLHRLVRAYLSPQDIAMTIGPAFGEFERAVKLERGFMHTTEASTPNETILKLLGVQRPRLVYVSRPNNPLGVSQSVNDLLEIAERCARLDALLIVDEAYAPFQPDLERLPAHPAIVRLESPGKIHGLVGLRLAYALAPEAVASALENLSPAWPLPASTAAALEALPRAQGFVVETLPGLLTDAARLAGELSRFTTVHFTGLHYLTLTVGDAKTVRDALLAHGVNVRDCSSFGLPDRIRVVTRLPQDNTVLVDALREITVPDGVPEGT
jgi:histidinol-phosphate aminotransferase